jgi:hypothetical protein
MSARTDAASSSRREDFHASILGKIVALAKEPIAPKAALLHVLRMAAKHRALLLQNTLLQAYGPTILGGPFAGMSFVRQVAEGCCVPKLLGCYEEELHPYVEEAVLRDYTQVLNIGVAEGYYAVGLARRMPGAKIFAFDIDDNAQQTCAAVARSNGVAERVQVGGLFRGEDFERYAEKRTLLVCDIEGAERQLLDPYMYPALQRMDVIVELHDCLIPGLSTEVVSRFEATHDVTLVKQAGRGAPLPPLFDNLSHLDRLLAVWEWRSGPTPWAVMIARP